MFKLYDPQTNQFAAGGGSWSKTGKTWTHEGHILSAMEYMKKLSDHVEVIEYEVVEKSRKSVAELKKRKKELADQKERQRMVQKKESLLAEKRRLAKWLASINTRLK